MRSSFSTLRSPIAISTSLREAGLGDDLFIVVTAGDGFDVPAALLSGVEMDARLKQQLRSLGCIE